jgi:hypothetical protein
MGVKREEVTIELSTSNHGICWAFILFFLFFYFFIFFIFLFYDKVFRGLSLLLKVMVDYFLIPFEE